MSLSSIFGAIRGLFRSSPERSAPMSEFVAVTEQHKVKASPPKKRHNVGHWVEKALKDYDGSRTVVVKVPPTVRLEQAQASVGHFMMRRFGPHSYRTRRFKSSHTIHVSLK